MYLGMYECMYVYMYTYMYIRFLTPMSMYTYLTCQRTNLAATLQM